MSRSYAKKYRMCNTISSFKRCANKKIRRTYDVPNGNAYKKLYCSYKINDGGRPRPIPDLVSVGKEVGFKNEIWPEYFVKVFEKLRRK